MSKSKGVTDMTNEKGKKKGRYGTRGLSCLIKKNSIHWWLRCAV